MQDVEADKVLQISQIDRIYARAALTLAATTGDSHSGLSGVSVPWRFTHQPDALGGMEPDAVDGMEYGRPVGGIEYGQYKRYQLAKCKAGGTFLMEVLEDPEAWLRDSTWRKRGWTLQEELC